MQREEIIMYTAVSICMETVENLSQEVRGFYVVMSQISCIFLHILTAAPQFSVNFVAVQGILQLKHAGCPYPGDIFTVKK